MATRQERKRMQYVRRHIEASHDTAAWLMLCLYWARWEFNEIGPEMPFPPDIPFSFSSPKERPRFRRAGAITPDHVEVMRSEYAAVCRILRAKATGEQFSQSDVDRIGQTINYRVSLLLSDDGLSIDKPTVHPRLAAELLLNYLDSLIWSHVPQSIGVCRTCGGLFLRIKANQTACSDHCRFKALRAEKYWSSQTRKHCRKLNTRNHQATPQKTGVKSGVECSGNVGTSRGKSGKAQRHENPRK